MIARAATAQDDETGDGTTSTVLFTGELLKFAERYISDVSHTMLFPPNCPSVSSAVLSSLSFNLCHFRVSQGVHPRIIADGFDLARKHSVAFLEGF